MITKLRKTHRGIWLVMAIVLPLLFIAAYKSISEYQIQEEFSTLKKEPKSQEVSYSIASNSAQLKQNGNEYSIEFKLDYYLPSVAANVYLTNIELNDYVNNGHLIGTVNGKGEYSFTVKPEILEPHHNFIVIYDPIKQKEIYNHINIYGYNPKEH